MANHQRFIKYLLSFVIAFSPVLLISNANASVGGWAMSNPVAQGASTVYNGAKNVLINGKDYIKKGTAIITPNASQVANVLKRGLGAAALGLAVGELIGDGVDWVLDPANNQIKYVIPATPTKQNSKYLFLSGHQVKYLTARECVIASVKNLGGTNKTAVNERPLPNGGIKFDVNLDGKPWVSNQQCSAVANPDYVKDEKEEKYLPLDAVAAKVISNAQNGDTNAQVATTAAAADIVSDAEKDNVKARPISDQLEQSSSTENTDADAQSKSNTANGSSTTKNETTGETTATDLALEFPTFCGWAPVVCESAQVVISFPNTLVEWWEISTKEIKKAYLYAESLVQDVKDYFKEQPETDTNIDIPLPSNTDIDTNINFSSSCPANYTLANFSYHGTSQNWEVDFSKFCDVFSTYVKPVVIAMGAFTSALIIGGVRTNE